MCIKAVYVVKPHTFYINYKKKLKTIYMHKELLCLNSFVDANPYLRTWFHE